LTLSGVWAFVATGYAFYDSYGFAIIDIWIAPLLWLGEVELFLWLKNKWGDKPFMVKLFKGLQKGIKWILIQYVFLAPFIVLAFLLTEVLDYMCEEDAYPIFQFTLLGFTYSIPFCTLLFAWWESFLPDRKYRWTYIIPWAAIVIIGIISASFSSYITENNLNVFHKICLITGGALVPVFGACIQNFIWFIRRVKHKNKIRKRMRASTTMFLCLAAITLIAFTNSCTKKSNDKQQEYSRKEIIYGIDVSHHNGKIDWKKVHDEYTNLQFVYIKCTEGTTYKDQTCITNAKEAKKQGFLIGGYHYFKMTSSAHCQFQNFKSMLDLMKTDLIPMVDVETFDGKEKQEGQDSLQVLLNLLEQEYGVTPMIYGTNHSYNKYCAPRFNKYPLYIGRHGDKPPVITGSGHYTIWQYTDKGIMRGIKKKVDLCQFHPKKTINDILL
jgi:lysozyme